MGCVGPEGQLQVHLWTAQATLLFGSPDVPHHNWGDCLIFRVLGVRLGSSWTDTCIFFVFFFFKRGYPGLVVSGESRKIRVVSEELGRVLRHVLWCVLPDGFRTDPILKTTCTDFDWGGTEESLYRSSGRCWDHIVAQPLWTWLSGQGTSTLNWGP